MSVFGGKYSYFEIWKYFLNFYKRKLRQSHVGGIDSHSYLKYKFNCLTVRGLRRHVLHFRMRHTIAIEDGSGLLAGQFSIHSLTTKPHCWNTCRMWPGNNPDGPFPLWPRRQDDFRKTIRKRGLVRPHCTFSTLHQPREAGSIKKKKTLFTKYLCGVINWK